MNQQVEDFLDVTAVPNPTAGQAELTPINPSDSDIVSTFGDIIDLLSFISIPLAVAAVVLIGLLIVASVVGANSEGAAKYLKKITYVLVGLVIVFNSHTIIGSFI